MSAPLLTVRELSAGFVAGERVLTAVDGVGFDLAAGETLALLGESGCGKSASALALHGLGKAVAFSRENYNVGMVNQPVNQGSRQPVVTKDGVPL